MLNTKLVMTITAIIMGIVGILLSFLPQESAKFIGWANTNTILLQILGAMYFSFAMINWTAKANLMGGIYGRPIAIGNFTHYVIVALALIKISSENSIGITMILATITYSILAILFGYILFTHPALKTKNK